ncbi:MAG: outer membrane protein assembly factor BamD [Candidatus Binatia bacterium]
MKKRCASLLMLVAVCAGCAAKKHLTADQYFQEATTSFRGDALSLAVEEYHELLDQYPFSPYNEEAELKIAHAQYLNGNYAEAIVALTDFQRRHPTSPQLPFVGYYLGMCYAQQMRTLDRDQTATQNALNYFLTVSQQYPDSPFAELGREQVARCRESLAQHEMYIAKFYAGQGKDRAAEIRLLTMASRYGDTDAGAAGLLRLARLYGHQKQEQNEVLAYQALTQLHPRGPEGVAAHRALDRLANVDPPSGDPLDLLLAANGRHRSTGTFETVQVPGLDTERTGRRPSAAAPAMVPPMDPFGRGRGNGFPY